MAATLTKEIFVPEAHFSKVPDSFSADSTILEVTRQNCTRGVILHNLKELELALRLYNGEVRQDDQALELPTSGEANSRMFNDIADSHGPLAGGLFAMASESMFKGKDLVGTMMQAAKCQLATRGRFYRSFDYDGMGSNFLKSNVEVDQVDGKFVLSINGSDADAELSAVLGRKVAQSRVNIEASLSVVDGWWYNLNLAKVLGALGPLSTISTQQWQTRAEALIKNLGLTSYKIPYQAEDGSSFDLVVSVDYHYYDVATEEGNRSMLTRALNGSIAGAAWPSYRRSGEEAVAVPAQLRLSLVHEGQDSCSAPVIDPAKTAALLKAADDIEAALRAQIVT